jgi:hypothetical protein
VPVIQIKRGLESGLPIGVAGEPLWTTDTYKLFISDGAINHLINTGGTVTNVTATSPLFSSGGTTPDITIQQSSAIQDGYLSSIDWTTFNNKLTSSLADGKIFVGSALNVATAQTMSGDATLANTGALTLSNTTVTPGSYTVNGNALFTVDSKGRLTSASNVTISIASLSPLTTKGDLFGFSTVNDRLPVAVGNGKILQVDSTAALGLSYTTTTYPNTVTVNRLLYASASNVISDLATANSSVLVTDGSGVPSWSTTLPSGLSGAFWKDGGTTTLTSANTITATGTNNFTMNFATLGANTGFSLASNNTDAVSNTQILFSSALSGANATASQTTTVASISNTKTGTLSNNIGLSITSSGAATLNTGISLSVGSGTSGPTIINAVGTGGGAALIKLDQNTSTTGYAVYQIGNGGAVWGGMYAAGASWSNQGPLAQFAEGVSIINSRTNGSVNLAATGSSGTIHLQTGADSQTSRVTISATGTTTFTTTVTTGTGSTSGTRFLLNALTSGDGLSVESSSATTGFLQKWTSTSTAVNHTYGTNAHVGVASSGANSTSGKNVVGVLSVISNTGTSSENVAFYAKPTGATNNFSYIGDGGLNFFCLTSGTSRLNTTGILQLHTGTGGSQTGLVLKSTGASSYTDISLLNDTGDQGQLIITGTTYAASSIRARGVALYGPAAGGVSIVAGNASGSVSLATGGLNTSNNRFVIDGNGNSTFTQGIQSASNSFLTFTQSAHTGGTSTGLTWTGGAHTSQATTVEVTDINFNLARVVKIVDGTTATQRAFRIQAPTYTPQTTAITLTDAATLEVGTITAGSGTTITRNWNTRFIGTGFVGFGGNIYAGSTAAAPTALVHIAAGSTSVAPIRLTSGSLTTGGNILAGNVEFLTDKFYGTISTGPAQKEFTLNDAALTSGRVPFATTNGRLTDDADFTFATDTLTVTKIAATTLTGNLTFADTINIVTNTSTGTKIGEATNQKIGIWNATPIVQPTTGVASATFVANTSANIVYQESTFDGYKIEQIVKALRNIGLLA